MLSPLAHTRRKPDPIPRSGLVILVSLCLPALSWAQSSPFMTGATSLQTNILAWLTPVAIILVMVLGGMAMANRIAQVSSTYGQGDAHTIVENCGNSLLFRCSASEGGGTARFASQLVGDREVMRTTTSRSRRFGEWFGSRTLSEHVTVEAALLPSQLEQLPDLTGYLKFASDPTWRRVRLSPAASANTSACAGPSDTAGSGARIGPRLGAGSSAADSAASAGSHGGGWGRG